MSVTVVNLDIEALTDYYVDTIYTDYTTNLPKNVTGYTALMELRASWDDPLVLLTLSNSNGRILLGGAEGTIIARFLPADTDPAQQNIPWSRAVYDLIITDLNGVKTKLLKGFINITGTVSR